MRRIAVNKMGDALAGGGTVFAADDKPELVKSAVPFSLKLMESLLAESPKHKRLLLATASGFTQYDFGFVQQEAEKIEDRDVAAALEMRRRARRLYLRARDYGLRGLEAAHPGFTAQLRHDSKAAVRVLKNEDVPLAYWTAVAWGGAIGIIKNDTDLIAELPLVGALIDRAFELDEAYNHGAIHSFLITFEMSRSGGAGDPVARARQHFDRAMALCRGQQAGPLVALAEAVCVPHQDRAEFQSLLNQALALDVDAKPEWRLVNLVMQHRARWLLRRTDDLIAEESDRSEKKQRPVGTHSTASHFSPRGAAVRDKWCNGRAGASDGPSSVLKIDRRAPENSGTRWNASLPPAQMKPARHGAPNQKV